MRSSRLVLEGRAICGIRGRLAEAQRHRPSGSGPAEPTGACLKPHLSPTAGLALAPCQPRQLFRCRLPELCRITAAYLPACAAAGAGAARGRFGRRRSLRRSVFAGVNGKLIRQLGQYCFLIGLGSKRPSPKPGSDPGDLGLDRPREASQLAS